MDVVWNTSSVCESPYEGDRVGALSYSCGQLRFMGHSRTVDEGQVATFSFKTQRKDKGFLCILRRFNTGTFTNVYT